MAQGVFLAKLFFLALVELPPPAVVTSVPTQKVSFSWFHGTESIARSSPRLPRSKGGWVLPCVRTMSHVLALRNTLSLLDAVDHSVRLLIHFLGSLHRDLLPRALSNPLYPNTASVLPFYSSVADIASTISQSLPGVDAQVLPPSVVAEIL